MKGFNTRKSLIIISDLADIISQEILHKHKRGVTFLNGTGAYSGQEKRVVLTVTTLVELPRIKEMIFKLDPKAFVVVNDTLEVLGWRHGKCRVY